MISLFFILVTASTSSFAAPRVLITAFEPFGGRSQNASLETLKALEGALNTQQIQLNLELHTAVLPVAYRTISEKFDEALETSRPELVLSLGEYSGNEVQIETIARNRDDARTRDNEGESRSHHGRFPAPAVIPGAADSLETTFPTAGLLNFIGQLTPQTELSNTAGAFLCNHLFFLGTYESTTRQKFTKNIPVGFIHVPSRTDSDSVAHFAQIVAKILEFGLLKRN